MLKKEMTEQEIIDELKSKGDFVKINYLTDFLEQGLSGEVKKFVYILLSEIYERTNMFSDAAKMHDNSAIFSVAFTEKIKHHVKEAELYIKAGMFSKSDDAMKKASSHANASEKQEIYFIIRDFYKRQALVYERDRRRNNAVKIYEKLLEMKISDLERQAIKKKLLELYDNLGRVKDYLALKNSFE